MLPLQRLDLAQPAAGQQQEPNAGDRRPTFLAAYADRNSGVLELDNRP